MWLSRILSHGIGGLICQWGSTIKSPLVRTITSRYPSWYDLRCCCKDVKPHQPNNNVRGMLPHVAMYMLHVDWSRVPDCVCCTGLPVLQSLPRLLPLHQARPDVRPRLLPVSRKASREGSRLFVMILISWRELLHEWCPGPRSTRRRGGASEKFQMPRYFEQCFSSLVLRKWQPP